MFAKIYYGKKVLDYYNEYKIKYGKCDIIGIIPSKINDDTRFAYTDNSELMESIKNKGKVKLYINYNLMKCPEKYVKAVLFHEYTHICDAYNFVEYDNSAILMSTYSEYNATKIEIITRCENNAITLNTIVNGEDGNKTLKEEIEDKMENIKMILEIADLQKKEKLHDEKKVFLFDYLVKNYSCIFAYLSFFEENEPKYFKNCFNRFDKYKYGQSKIAETIYGNIKSLDKVLGNTDIILNEVVKLYLLFFSY